MANFIALVYATLKKEGIDTKGMSTDEAVKKFNELKNNSTEDLKEEERQNYKKSITKKEYDTGVTKNYNPKMNIEKVNAFQTNDERFKNHINEYKKDLEAEPKVTKDMTDIANKLGSELLGYDYRVKSADSFLRKMQKEPDGTVNDNVRYTFKMEENPVKFYSDVVENLQKLGYEEIKTKNYWIVEKPPYRGINSNFKTPDGRIIEVQYHTPESIKAKEEKSHKLYEEQRKYDEGTPEFEKYDKMIQEVWDTIKKPEGIEKIKHKNWRG